MWIYVGLGGMVGTLSRYFLQHLIPLRSPVDFPLGTLTVNLSGSLALGFIARLALDAGAISPELRAGLTIGICGGFTTMSAFAFESVQLMGHGQYLRAGVYTLTTVVGSMVAVAAGAAIAQNVA